MQAIKEIMMASADLDANGVHIGGSDRESNHHYGDAYERIIEETFCHGIVTVPMGIGGRTCLGSDPDRTPARERVKLMMEVGVAGGASLLAWRDIFPNAHCVGVDIHHSDRAHGDRIEFRLGDQRSQRDCEEAAAGRQFDFIVEDATHQLADSLVTLLYLWPHVRPGGIYVIEEFSNVGALRRNIAELWSNAEIVDTVGPSGGVEPLVVFRKPA